MKRSIEQLGIVLLCGVAACAQQKAPKIKVNLEGFRYPPLARMARIQGDVIFEVTASGAILVAGNRILGEAAQLNLETWTLSLIGKRSLLVVYRFSLSGPKPERICEPSYNTRKESQVGTGDDRISVLVTAPSCVVPTNAP